jgi:hypothetical protein
MPKPFLIGVEIEERAFGAAMRRIDALPGVIRIHLKFSKEKIGGKPNGRAQNGDRKPPGRFDIPGEEAIAKILHGKSPMTASQLADAFATQGRSPKSISSCIHKMRTNGEIISGPEGYTLTKKMRDRLRSKKAKKK